MSNGGSYDPHAVESEIYRFWEAGGYFHATPDPNKKPYVIDIPLPNVTGALHLGHALNNTLQDILIRHKRMCGYEALWMPGTDHAGIATQAVVERELKKKHNLTRHELGREGLVKKIWEWKEEYGERILDQLRKMGFSCDWARTRFTLDEVCAKAVYEVFFRWFKAGLIYRGTRLVNWDAFLQTAVADDEVVYETVKGHFWHYRYPILPSEPEALARETGTEARRHEGTKEGIEGSRDQGVKEALARAVAPDAKYGVDYLSIATTRPETMLGDTAICVHPDDERYKHLVGKHCLLPLMNRPIPIIADGELAKMEMGTGCVKVTPGHDPKDYACGQRHNLPMINILTPDGKINENGRGQGGMAAGGMGAGGMAASGPRSAAGNSPDAGASRESGVDAGGHATPSAIGGHATPSAIGGHATHVCDYVGLDRYEARKKVVADLEALGLMEKIKPYETEVGHSDRSKTPIEPMLSEQWFMKMGELAELAMDAVRDGRVRFFPERYAKTYLDWLGEKRDWCISRQLWWGHRIPVWHRRVRLTAESSWTTIVCNLEVDHAVLGEVPGTAACIIRTSTGADWSSHLKRTAIERAKDGSLVYHIDMGAFQADWLDEDFDVFVCVENPGDGAHWEKQGFVQDPDVLDTWFSSALWPFSTLGWPHREEATRQQGNKATRREDEEARPAATPPASMPGCPDASLPSPADFAYFYPTSTLVTARGIITLWVARMVMTGLYFTRRVPFQHVHIHPIIQDGQGRTMSKSLGNGVDPLDIIALYGTDALRFTMAQMDTETQDVRLPVKPVKLPMSGAGGGTGVPAGVGSGTGVPAGVGSGTGVPAGESAGQFRTVNSSEKFELGRNFCNKIWQAATGVVLPNLGGIKGSRDQGIEGATALEQCPGATAVSAVREGEAPAEQAMYAPRSLTAGDLALEDHWILSRLAGCIAECDRRLERYQISEVANTLYAFFWSDFCDWYLELVKPRLFGPHRALETVPEAPARDVASAPRGRRVAAGLRTGRGKEEVDSAPAIVPRFDDSAAVARQVLAWVLDQSLRLLHPIIPFVTEALWMKLNAAAPQRGIASLRTAEEALITAAWPSAPGGAGVPARELAIEREMEALQNVIRALRDTLARINTGRSAVKQPAIGKLPRAVIRADQQIAAGLQQQHAVLERLGRCENVEIGPDLPKPPESATQVLPVAPGAPAGRPIEIYVPLSGLMDLSAERRRLQKERDELASHIERLTGKLANEGFVAKAPAAVVEQERARLTEMRDRLATLERNLADLE